MPYKERTVDKLYWTIGEVAAEMQVKTSLIRYWEKEIGDLKLKRTTKGDRLFEQKDIEQLKLIHHLVKEKGFTLHGARANLRKSGPEDDNAREEVRQSLLRIRERLLQLMDHDRSL